MVDINERKILRLIEQDGWRLARVKGSHHQYKHQTKTGTVAIPHPKKELPNGTIKSIMKQAGLE